MRKRARNRFRSIHCGCEKGTIIGHLPRKVSRVCSLLCDREVATIECTVREREKYSTDLAQGGLELSTFQSNAYRNGTSRFRKPVDWTKVVSDRRY